ncbi:hypothetical protein V6Z12_A03G241700 [Gossypium hirsutum]
MGNQQFFQFTNDDFTLHVPLESLCRQFIGNYNKVADWMAKFGKGSYDEMHIFRVVLSLTCWLDKQCPEPARTSMDTPTWTCQAPLLRKHRPEWTNL